ncbi:UNVERIFIED_CONTAM: hypothetical protein FKN15_037147, partial [Acipenser sinensis]
TPAAVNKIKHLLQNKPDYIGMKVGVRTRGCNGLSYTLEYTKEKGKADEEVIQDEYKYSRTGAWSESVMISDQGTSQGNMNEDTELSSYSCKPPLSGLLRSFVHWGEQRARRTLGLDLQLPSTSVRRHLHRLPRRSGVQYLSDDLSLRRCSFVLSVPVAAYQTLDTGYWYGPQTYCIEAFPSVYHQKTFILYTFLVVYLLPLVTICVCYAFMLKRMSRPVVEPSDNNYQLVLGRPFPSATSSPANPATVPCCSKCRSNTQSQLQLHYKDWPISKLLKAWCDKGINIPTSSDRMALFNSYCKAISAEPVFPPRLQPTLRVRKEDERKEEEELREAAAGERCEEMVVMGPHPAGTTILGHRTGAVESGRGPPVCHL